MIQTVPASSTELLCCSLLPLLLLLWVRFAVLTLSIPLSSTGCSYNCFAPILKAGTIGPNLFWAACPWQKAPCASALEERSACVSSWFTAVQSGVAWSGDIEYMLHEAIDEQTLLWKMPSPPPHYVVIHWENVHKTYQEAFTAFWATLLTGNLIIIIWWILRRSFLRCFCAPKQSPEYSILN